MIYDNVSEVPKGEKYLRLYHGRHDPDKAMDDWGTEGPAISFEVMRFTYGKITLFDRYETAIVIELYEDMVCFDNVYYGDFEVAQV